MTGPATTVAPPSLANHCECGHPMVVLLDDWDIYVGGQHDPDREGWEGLAAVLDGHHRAMLCGTCDGTDAFDAHHHQSMGEGA